MNAVDFCRWLQGFAELSAEAPTPEQWKSIKEHLALVFLKVTPPAPGSVPAPGDPTPMLDAIREIRKKQEAGFDPWRPPYEATC